MAAAATSSSAAAVPRSAGEHDGGTSDVARGGERAPALALPMVARRRGLRPTVVRVRGTRRRALRTRRPSAPPSTGPSPRRRAHAARDRRDPRRSGGSTDRKGGGAARRQRPARRGPATESNAAARYVASVCSSTPAAASAALASSRVAIFGSAPAGAEVSRLLRSAGATTATWASRDRPGSDVDLVVAAPAAQEVQRLASLNEQCLRDATPWLALLPSDGRFAAVGLLFVPGQTACHACYLLRRGATSGYEHDFSLLERGPVRAPMPAATNAVAAGIAALICLRWLGARDPTLPGALYALELQGTLALTRHRVLRVPRCPACGPTSPPASPWFRELDAGAA